MELTKGQIHWWLVTHSKIDAQSYRALIADFLKNVIALFKYWASHLEWHLMRKKIALFRARFLTCAGTQKMLDKSLLNSELCTVTRSPGQRRCFPVVTRDGSVHRVGWIHKLT